MNIHNQFSINYFIVFIVILLAVNLLIFKFKKRDWRELFNWKLILLALVFTFWDYFILKFLFKRLDCKNLWFSKNFYLKKYLKTFAFENFIQEFNYFNFIQNFHFFSCL
jgi:hypothetical protein